MPDIMSTITSYIIPAAILLGILIFVHELGHFLLAKWAGVKVLKFSLGFGPKIVGKTIGETQYLISAFPLGGYVKLLGEDPDEEVDEAELHRSFPAQSLLKRLGILAAGSLFNIVFAALLFSVIYLIGVPVLTSEIGKVTEGFPADKAGIKAGDRIVKIDGKKIDCWEDMASTIRGNTEGKELSLEIERNNILLQLKVTPQITADKNIFGEEIKASIIGITPGEDFITKRYNPFMAGWYGTRDTWQWSKLTLLVVWKLAEGKVSPKTLGGPILIAQMAGKVMEVGIINFLHFMAILGINLGIINLFPIPALDGGHILFLGIEAVRRKPLSVKSMEFVQRIGIALLVVLMGFVFYNDIARIVNG